MTQIMARELAQRDECERLARAAERRMSDPSLSQSERFAAMEDAKVYWQLSRVHADAVTAAERARPAKFTAQNIGATKKTEARRALLWTYRRELGVTARRAEIVSKAQTDPDFKDLFSDFEKALNFANRNKI